MANESKFKAGQMYGAEDINNTIAFMTTEGVLEISTPNEICKSLLETGISNQDKRMAVSIVDGKVQVANGSCIMHDGSTYTIYEDGETLDYTPGVLNYVYVVVDNTILKNVLKCTTTEPPADAILLAEINVDGTITDKRVYSRYKFPSYKSNVNDSKKIEVTLEAGYGEIDLGSTDYKNITVFAWEPHVTSRDDYGFAAYSAMFFISDGKVVWNISIDGSRCTINNIGGSAATLKYNSDGEDQGVYVSVSDGILHISPWSTISNRNYLLDIYVG